MEAGGTATVRDGDGAHLGRKGVVRRTCYLLFISAMVLMGATVAPSRVTSPQSTGTPFK